ncbi:MAG TPA: PilZ domain-containing protein [Polyangiaceae bacterium]|nr:PilZ domain-containing protein [Polyangiaceae bacterium]
MNTEDRRAPGATRMPFDALVEVGGALGPSFEAQAINVSEEGMHLRTAYLPEQGQPLTCRFDGGPGGQSVLASGEVVWSHPADRGGEFGIRFTDMDAESVDVLKRICGLTLAPAGAAASDAPPANPGGKVRLHIDGLASPMKAKVRDARRMDITVGSDLGFLQVGKQLELEDATNGNKRPASIDRVEVAVDPSSNVPQLVVTLRYEDTQSSAEIHAPLPQPFHAPAPAPKPSRGDDLAAIEEASAKMKGALAENLSKVGPAVERFAERAKTMVQLLAKKRQEQSPARRTTAPAPGGGLHASGRRVVRGEEAIPVVEDTAELKHAMFKRKAMVGLGVMLAAVLGAMVLKKSHHDEAADNAPASSSTATEVASAAPAAPPPAAPAAENTPSFAPSFPAPGQMASADDDGTKPAHKKHLHVAPFGNGPVHHGNTLRLKMDGPIESIEGAQQPTGFVVKLPGRKSVEAAAPLAARDSRIAAIKVTNEGAGAELTLAFKDGVPNYQVMARGDTLVIALAPIGAVDDTMAKKDEKGSSKHKHKHAKGEQEL